MISVVGGNERMLKGIILSRLGGLGGTGGNANFLCKSKGLIISTRNNNVGIFFVFECFFFGNYFE